MPQPREEVGLAGPTNANPAREQLETQSKRLLARLLREAAEDEERFPVRQDEVLFAITGERGSGKTTLLRHMVSSVQNHKHLLWLPIIRPDNLASSQSLLVTAIGSLVKMTASLKGEWADAPQLQSQAERALRSTLFSQTSSIEELFENSGSLGQFTADASSVLRRGSDLEADLQQLVTGVLAASGARAIVVPIDDLDLIPAQLGRVLADARLLGSQPGILPVACLSRNDLRAKLRAELMASLPGVAGLELERLVDQQIMKTLRPDRVFQPLQLPRQDRLQFAPVASAETLGDSLQDLFSIMDGHSDASLSSWFARQLHAPDARRTTDLQWLPTTYRGLEHLLFEASALREALQRREWYGEVGSRISALLDCLAREHAFSNLSLEVESLRPSPDGVHIQASVDWPSMRLGVASAGPWKRLFQSGTTGTRVMLRRAERPIGWVTPDSSDSPRANDDRAVVPSQDLAVALLSDSILSSRIFDEPKPVGPLALLDGSCEFLQSIRVHGLPTDDKLVLLPASTGIVHVGRWLLAWNWMVEEAKSRPANAGLSSLAADLCRGTTKLWLFGEDVANVGSSRSFRRELDDAADAYVELAPNVSDGSNWAGNPNTAYCEWFEILLPRIFHEALLAPDEILGAVATWSAAVSTGGRGYLAFERIADWYRPLLQGDISARSRRERLWLYGYRVLLRNVNPELVQQLGAFAQEYDERKGRGSKGREAIDSVVVLEESSSRYKFASRATLEGKEQVSRILGLLDQLRQV